METNNRGAGRTVTCSAPEKLDCVLPGLLAVGAVWVLCGACGRVQVIWCYGLPLGYHMVWSLVGLKWRQN